MSTHAISSSGRAVQPRKEPKPHRRRWLVLVAIAGFVLLLVILKSAQIATLIGFGKRAQKAGPPPETVGTASATAQTWDQTLDAVGSVTAARGVSISND